MQIELLGAAQTVTGSMHLVRTPDVSIVEEPSHNDRVAAWPWSRARRG